MAHSAAAADACSAAYERAQELRRDGDLLHARGELYECNKPQCADFIRADCGQWLGEVDTALPSVSVDARDGAGHALTQVRVSVDGVVVASELSGLAVPVNPGKHHFKFESAGFPALEQDVFLAEGQKSQLVELKFELPPAAQARPPAGGAPRRIGPTVYAFGTLSAVGLAGFAAFGITGLDAEHSLRASPCASTRTCTDAQTSPIEKKYLLADISLSVAVVSLGVATYFLFAHSEAPASAPEASSPPRLDMRVGPSSLMATLSASY